MNLTSRNEDPMHASLALSSLLSVWYKLNSLNNKSMYNTLLLEFYICAKPRLTYWYPCPKKKCHYFCTGVYINFNVWDEITYQFANFNYCTKLILLNKDTILYCLIPRVYQIQAAFWPLDIFHSWIGKTKIIFWWRYGNSNYWKPNCSFNSLFRLTIKKSS